MAIFCYFYTRQIVKQNIFEQLEITPDKLQEHVRVFIEGKIRKYIQDQETNESIEDKYDSDSSNPF